MTADQINAGFEVMAIIFALCNVGALIRDRRVAGVSVAAVIGFTCMGIWNLYFYPSLQQIWSGYAAGGVVLANCLWLALAWRWRPRRRLRLWPGGPIGNLPFPMYRKP